jgi:hypothetical protein
MLDDRWYRDEARQNRSGLIHISGVQLTTTSGALAAVVKDVNDSAGCYTITKVGATAGRYLVQFVNSKGEAVSWLRICGFRATLLTDDATAAYPVAKGFHCHLRNATPALTTVASNGQVLVQFTRTDTNADAEIDDGCGFILEFDVKKSSASP